MTFRQKFFLSYVALLILFLAILYPFVTGSVNKIVYDLLISRQDELVGQLVKAKNQDALIQILKQQKHYSFFRIALHDIEQKVLYDSHTKRLNRPLFFPFQFTSHPEVVEALNSGQGYAEEYSEILGQVLIYVAKRFELADGSAFILRLAFAHQFVEELRSSFQTGFIYLAAFVLILFALMAGLVLHKLTRPIQEIIDTIRPYQEGKVQKVPKIALNIDPKNDFNRLAMTLNSLSDQIQKQIEMHKDFVANASHELKTPITIIHGFAETLHDNDNLPQTTCHEITKKIVSSCERMTKTIKNLLTLADVENLSNAQKLAIDLVELTENCIDTLQAAYKHAKVHFNYDEECLIFGDPSLIEVAIMNLLENAAKYAKEEPVITVSLKKLAGSVSLSIEDNGIGIKEEDLQRIFERFFRVHSKKVAGSGLGLSLVDTIIQRHGGRIEVRSIPSKGSTFTIVFQSKRMEEALPSMPFR